MTALLRHQPKASQRHVKNLFIVTTPVGRKPSHHQAWCMASTTHESMYMYAIVTRTLKALLVVGGIACGERHCFIFAGYVDSVDQTTVKFQPESLHIHTCTWRTTCISLPPTEKANAMPGKRIRAGSLLILRSDHKEPKQL